MRGQKKLENISIHYAIPSNNINALCGAVVIQLIDNRLLFVDFQVKGNGNVHFQTLSWDQNR